MEAKVVVPWVFVFLLFLLSIIMMILFITKECVISECPTGPEEDPENPTCPTGCESPPTYICTINDPQNTPFQNKPIRFGFTGKAFYLAAVGSTIALNDIPDGNSLWSYNGNTITHSASGNSLRYIGVNSNGETGYFYNGFIQLFPSDGHYYENWDFDGYNFYLRQLTTNTTRYMLTLSVPFSNTILTINPVSNYMVGRSMNSSQALVVEL